MIPQRIELRTHPYQKYALPIKLRNLLNRNPQPSFFFANLTLSNFYI